MSNSRETILNALKEAVTVPSELDTAPADVEERIQKAITRITPKKSQELVHQFQKELEDVSGEFHRVKNEKEAATIILRIMKQKDYGKIAVVRDNDCQKIFKKVMENDASIIGIQALDIPYPDRKNELAGIPIALVKAPFSIADIGSLVFPLDDTRTSLPHFLSDCIIAVISRKNLLANQFELFKKLSQEKTKHMVLVTGPSRTADIEKILILGAHGPRRLVVLMFD